MKIKAMIILFIIFILTFSLPVFAYDSIYNMSWDFEIFNNPDARQVAINIAEKQDSLVVAEKSDIERFAEGLDRRIYSLAQRKVVDMIANEDEAAFGEFEAGNLQISVAEDPQTGEVIVEVTDVITGETTIITYSNEDFGSDFSY
jgi:curli production assembly/transport component CsgF